MLTAVIPECCLPGCDAVHTAYEYTNVSGDDTASICRVQDLHSSYFFGLLFDLDNRSSTFFCNVGKHLPGVTPQNTVLF
jgi:hypothetical protein